MPCPTCSHTMERIHTCRADEVMVFQCPRCGTTRVEDSGADEPSVYVPKLVSNCRIFFEVTAPESPGACLGLLSHKVVHELLRRVGITEAIDLPKDRRPE